MKVKQIPVRPDEYIDAVTVESTLCRISLEISCVLCNVDTTDNNLCYSHCPGPGRMLLDIKDVPKYTAFRLKVK